MDYRPLYENAIIIAPTSEKGFFNAYHKAFPKTKFDVLTIEEVEKMFCYSYDEEALCHLVKLGYSYPLAKELLVGLSHMQDKDYRSEKLNSLVPLFKELRQAGLLYNDAYPFLFFKGRNILIRGYVDGFRIASALESLPNISLSWDIKEAPRKDLIKVFPFDDVHDELHALCNDIAGKLSQGYKPEDIFIVGLPSECLYEFRLLCADYHIPFAGEDKACLLDLPLAKEILRRLEKEEPSAILESFASEEEDENVQSLLDQLYRYGNLGLDKKKLISTLEDVYKDKKTRGAAKGGINLINSREIPDGCLAYIVDFSFAKAPSIKRDNGYFDDKECSELGLPTSLKKNGREEKELETLLRRKEVVYASYSLSRYGTPIYPSPWAGDGIHSELGAYEYKEEYSFEAASFYGASLNDAYNKVRKDSPYRDSLNKAIPPTPVYDPSFKPYEGAGRSGDIHLSFSSIDKYFRCPFSYYLSYVLKLKDEESAFNMRIGNILHSVMEKVDVRPIDLERCFNEALAKEEESGGPFSSKERFYLEGIKERFFKTVEYLKMNYANIVNGKFIHEMPVSYLLDEHTELVGKIDLAITSGPSSSYLSILDFKTGGKAFVPAENKFGLGLQLPIYAYFAKHVEGLKGHKLLGTFFVPLVGKEEADSPKYLKEMNLSGVYEYIPAINEFSPENEATGFLNKKQGVEVENEGELGDNLASVAEEKIKEANERIREGDFKISPIVLGDREVACEYCPYGDICFLKEEFKRYESTKENNDEADA